MDHLKLLDQAASGSDVEAIHLVDSMELELARKMQEHMFLAGDSSSAPSLDLYDEMDAADPNQVKI